MNSALSNSSSPTDWRRGKKITVMLWNLSSAPTKLLSSRSLADPSFHRRSKLGRFLSGLLFLPRTHALDILCINNIP